MRQEINYKQEEGDLRYSNCSMVKMVTTNLTINLNVLDHSSTLPNGQWFIYDHYVTMKERSPDFHLASDTTMNIAVWVDKNTLTHKQGKYARLCVEVKLSKPLLAMFTIKDRRDKIEYEGLHLLCTMCGRYGNYKEGCPDKNMQKVDPNKNVADNAKNNTKSNNGSLGVKEVIQVPNPIRPLDGKVMPHAGNVTNHSDENITKQDHEEDKRGSSQGYVKGLDEFSMDVVEETP
ncbi:hypothetical protein KIW84_035842 [Lathyrus oleraceus]|uniref:Zinc knuckle CX2CX4HX4C n=1 Tax=Pisum sativum TaxID=3888 RepID=A0A9D5B794_PEA|nr:hypothetical protein KIW84_035842 [Pisum sativum]